MMTATEPLPLPYASQGRGLFWEQVMSEVLRNPLLSICGERPVADAPDVVVVDLARADVRVMHDASVLVAPGDEAALDRRRARHVASQIETRRRELEAIGTVVARAQRVYLEGERPMPARVTLDELVAALPDVPPRRLAAYVATGWLEHDGQRFALARLVDGGPPEVRRISAAPARSPVAVHARR